MAVKPPVKSEEFGYGIIPLTSILELSGHYMAVKSANKDVIVSSKTESPKSASMFPLGWVSKLASALPEISKPVVSIPASEFGSNVPGETTRDINPDHKVVKIDFGNSTDGRMKVPVTHPEPTL